MPFTVIYDANVLYPSVVRDVLIRLARAGLVQARWTDQILDETFRNLKKNRSDLDPAKLDRTRELMCNAVPDSLITGYEPLVDAIEEVDEGDRHVVAAAIKAHAQVIVTCNMKHFPNNYLTEQWSIEAKHPDSFITDLFYLDATTAHQVVSDIASSTKAPPRTVGEIIDAMEDLLPLSAALLRR